MQCNVGNKEQVLRIAIGSAIVFAGAYYRKWWGLIGIAPIVTGTTRYCPLNAVLGISNCKAINKS